MYAPHKAWANLTTAAAPGSAVMELPTSVQVLYFEYSGEPCEVLVEDSDGASITSYTIAPNTNFYIEMPDIRRVRFPSPILLSKATKTQYIDLYNDSWLNDKWQTIAMIDIESTIKDASAQLQSGGNPLPSGLGRRVADSGSLPPELLESWKSVLQAFSATNGTGQGIPQGLSAWDLLSLATQPTWKASVLSGFGYIDGLQAIQLYNRDHEPSSVQHLKGPSDQTLAYRVRTDDSKQRSNYIIVNPGRAPELEAPKPFAANSFVVKPTMVNTNTDGTTIKRLDSTTPSPTLQLRATGHITWTQRNYWESGLELGISRATPLPSDDVPTRYAPDVFEGLNRIGEVACDIAIEGDDWRVDFLGRSFDGWDRISIESTSTARPLLDFQPPPPVLGDGFFDASNSTVKIFRDQGSDWKLDPFSVTHAPRVFLSQRIGTPITTDVTIASVVPQKDGQYLITIVEIIDPLLFAEGQIAADPISSRIESVNGKVLTVSFAQQTATCEDPSIPVGPRIFQAGPAKLIQSAFHASLWVETGAEWVLEAGPGNSLILAADAIVTRQLPPQAHAEIALFAARVELNDVQVPHPPLKGPFSNTVPVIKLPLPPPVPGQITVSAAGVDYYGRTVFEISLVDFEDGNLEVLWSLNVDTWTSPVWSPPGRLPHPGIQAAIQQTAFAAQSKSGIIGSQIAFEGHLLYEVLPIDYYNKDVWITIGVRRLNESGIGSNFSLAEYLAVAP
jgi:hypothetical protein